jgi:hypothetical protein
MWKHCCAFVCAIGALLFTGSGFVVLAQHPSSLPRVQFADLIYTGAFRLPAGIVNGDEFSIGGRPIAFNPTRNSLFVGSRLGKLAEVSIPTPVNSSNVNALPFASFLQGFYDPTEGNMPQLARDGAAIDSVMVYGNRLYGTASIYYDANNTQRVSHYSRSLQLDQPSFSGWSQVWNSGKSGFVSGLMGLVPAEWQSLLGGAAISGQCCIPIVWRTSWGPAAFAFNPADIGRPVVAATPLLYYTGEHPTLGQWSGASNAYGATAQVAGVAVIAGTRTALYFGRNGLGPYCYGNGTSNQGLHNTTGPDGATWCYDPTTSDKGSHAYPYRYQIWAYDLNDLAAVKAGSKQPWDVVPYGIWPFDLPMPETGVKIGGVGYDSQRQLLYVSQLRADEDGYGHRPIIHVLKVAKGSGAPPPTPGPGTGPGTPVPGPSTRTTSVALTANRVAPQPPGTTITWTAAPTGGAAPHQYKWWTYDGSRWIEVSAWTTASTFNWTPGLVNADSRVAVWVRSAGNGADEQETSTAVTFPISGSGTPPPTTTPPPASGRVSAVALTANRVAPQAPGTTITWSAAPTGGAAPHQYKWWVFDGSAWVASGSWTTSSTFNWTPARANANYMVAAWARSAGNAVDAQEASKAVAFAISGSAQNPPPTTPPPTPSPGSARVTAVTLAVNQIAPQPPGTTITVTAVPTGGRAPHQYKWWTYDGSRWIAMTGWGASNSYAWRPTTANSRYRVAAWARSAGNNVDDQEASGSVDFPISGSVSTPPPTTPPPTTPPPTTPPPATKMSSVRITADRTAPQAPGTRITFQAAPVSGVAPHQYKWWIYDGSRWTASTGWSTSTTFAWTPSSARSNYSISVWARSAGATADVAEAATAMSFPISSTATPTPPPATSPRVSAVTLSASKAAPRRPGSSITWTAAPTGGAGPVQYKFYVFNSVTWIVVRGWSTSNTFTWTPTTANQHYQVSVWARSNGNNTDAQEASATAPYPILAGASASLTPDATATPRMHAPAVTRAAGVAGTSPLAADRFTAIATIGSAARATRMVRQLNDAAGPPWVTRWANRRNGWDASLATDRPIA